MMGIEPIFSAWQADVLPLDDIRPIYANWRLSRQASGDRPGFLSAASGLGLVIGFGDVPRRRFRAYSWRCSVSCSEYIQLMFWRFWHG